MHIISGAFKGRKIIRPKGIRPTQDKVRKALFDILGDINRLSFLDLYAGSGAVGLEALSQGAKRAVFVERERRCIKTIKENVSNMGFPPETDQSLAEARERANEIGCCWIIGLDVFQALKKLDKGNEKFDIIFLDPPYYQGLPPHQLSLKKKQNSNWCRGVAKKTLICLIRYDILAGDGFIVYQHFKSDILPESIDYLRLIKQAKYGDTFLSFYKKQHGSG